MTDHSNSFIFDTTNIVNESNNISRKDYLGRIPSLSKKARATLSADLPSTPTS